MPSFVSASAGIDAKIPSYYHYTQTILSFPYPKFHACDTLPQLFQCALILECEIYLQHFQHLQQLRMDTNTCMYK